MTIQNAANQVNVGDIFTNTWGYDQTNVDFYQVIRKTAKTIIIRKIKQVTKEVGFMVGYTVPIPNDFSNEEEIRKTPYEYTDGVSYHSGRIYIPFQFGCGERWDGKPESCSWYA